MNTSVGTLFITVNYININLKSNIVLVSSTVKPDLTM